MLKLKYSWIVIFSVLFIGTKAQNYVENFNVYFEANLSQHDTIKRFSNDSIAVCTGIETSSLNNVDEIIIKLSDSAHTEIKRSTIKIDFLNNKYFELISSTNTRYFFGTPYLNKINISNAQKMQLHYVEVCTKNKNGSISNALTYEIQ